MTFGERVLDGLGPGFARNAGPLLEPFVSALTADVETADAMLTPTEDLWPALFDLASTFSPGWLAQFAGVRIDPTVDVERQRELILTRPGWATGTYVALRAALKERLAGLQRVFIAERDTSAWHATITIPESDFAPGTTQELLEAIAESHRPAGMTFDVIFLAATSYGAAEISATTYATAEATAGTYADAES